MIVFLFLYYFNFHTEIYPFLGKEFKLRNNGILLNSGCFIIFQKDIWDLRFSNEFIFLNCSEPDFLKNILLPNSENLFPQVKEIFKNRNGFLLWDPHEISLNITGDNIYFSIGRIPISWELLDIYSLFSFLNPPNNLSFFYYNKRGVEGFLTGYKKDFLGLEYGIFPQKYDTIHSMIRGYFSFKERDVFFVFKEPFNHGLGISQNFFNGVLKFEFLKNRYYNWGIGYEYFTPFNMLLRIEFISFSNGVEYNKVFSIFILQNSLRSRYSIFLSYNLGSYDFVIFPYFSYLIKDNLNINLSTMFYIRKGKILFYYLFLGVGIEY